MSRRLSIPLLLDIAIIDAPDHLAEANSTPGIDRRWPAGGRLVNAVLRRRIEVTFKVGDRLLPAFLPRDDADRARDQAALEERLNGLSDADAWRPADIDRLAAFVTGDDRTLNVGVVVQELVGRLFVPDYAATAASYAAARLLDEYPRSNPFKAVWWRLSGQHHRARRQLWKLAGEDPHCIHATAIAMHNLVAAIETMRDLAADPASQYRLTEETVVGQCMVAPRAVLRTSAAWARVSFLNRPLRNGTLMVTNLRDLHDGTAHTGLALGAGEWSQCPAHRFVPRVLRAVWRAAVAKKPEIGA